VTQPRPRFGCLEDWLSWQQTLHPRKIDLGLGRVRRVFERLLSRYRQPPTVTVAGTNGKGSCVALLDAMLRAAGYRVGAYTSPHLLRYNERIRIDGVPVTDGDICAAFARIDRVRDGVSLSFFEFATLAALDLFHRAGVEVQLLEVGLGGRLDAVNMIDADVAVVTSVDIDHKEWLGEDREAIGLEKAGVLRTGRPAIIGDRQPPASLLRHGAKLGARLFRLGRDFDHRLHGETWEWRDAVSRLEGLPLPALPGRQQLDNAAVAVAALRKFSLPVAVDAIRSGLTRVHLPGRYQLIDDDPPLLLDVAHNPQAVRLLSDYLAQRFPGRRLLALFAAMADKDIEGMLRQMKDRVAVWALAPLPGNSRAASMERLHRAFAAEGLETPLSGFADCRQALAALRRQARPDDVIVIFGSFFLAAEILASDG